MPRPLSAEKPTIGTSLTWANDASSRSASLRHALDDAGVVVGQEVGLVDGNHQRTAFLDHPAGDGKVLLLGHVGGIEHHHHDVGQPDGVERVGDRGRLQLGVDAAAAAHAGGVDQAHRRGRSTAIRRGSSRA